MNLHDLATRLHRKNPSKIVLAVADGLGGLPMNTDGQTELEAARTPNLDALANEGTTGLLHPVRRGITCGSGPGHLALFGYDPTKFIVGRGVLTALGVGSKLQSADVAARGNFCTVGIQFPLYCTHRIACLIEPDASANAKRSMADWDNFRQLS
jgi:2,3-bisphosphoglycerate-independent phosphoglycerate mutase